LRQYFPAIGVGADTALADDPRLTIREDQEVVGCPLRFVFDRHLKTASALDQLSVYNDEYAERTILVTSNQHAADQLRAFEQKSVSIFPLPLESQGFPIESFREWLREREILGLLLEGGRRTAGRWFQCRGIDYLYAYQSPRIFGSADAPGFVEGLKVSQPDEAPCILKPKWSVFGSDILTHGYLNYPDQLCSSPR